MNDQNKVEEDVDSETQAMKALFVVTECHSTVHLVLRVNHLMRAEIEKDSIYKAKSVFYRLCSFYYYFFLKISLTIIN